MRRAKHSFVICAYKESPYLEECILSLKKQMLRSEILICTSTPNAYISGLAKKYDLPVYVNPGESGITQDWNFALSKVRTRYATIAHQDDVYEPSYSLEVLKRMKRSRRPIIAFTDYAEIRNGVKTTDVRMLKIKRFMMIPLRPRFVKSSRFIRRRVLSFGDPICCPSVTYALDYVERPVFADHFRSCEDWEAWEKLSRMKGDFLYIPKPLTCHRIHEGSETTAIIRDHQRGNENLEMFSKFWPMPVAKLINRFYNKSEESNDLNGKEC